MAADVVQHVHVNHNQAVLGVSVTTVESILNPHLLFLPGGSPILAPKTNPGPKGTSSAPLRVNLLQFRKNVSDLRMQLHQMRQIQARAASP